MLGNWGGVINLLDNNYDVDTQSLVYGSGYINWSGPSEISGSTFHGLSGLQTGFKPDTERFIFNQPDAKEVNFSSFDFVRDANYTGGVGGNVSNLMRVTTNIGANVGDASNRKPEWAFLAKVESDSDYANAVAITGQAVKNADGAVWAAQFNTIDYNTPINYAVRAIEANIECEGPDTNNLRWIQQIVSASKSGNITGNDNVYTGLLVGTNTADLKHGIIINDNPTKPTKILDSALKIETEARCISLIGKDTPVVIASENTSTTTGTLSQSLNLGKNDSGETVTYSEIRHRSVTNTSGAENGQTILYVQNSGSLVKAMQISGGDNAIRLRVANEVKLVSQGAADSGGEGYRVLRVAN